MRLLGIDYGTRRIGIALTDETGRFPAPLTVIQADSHAVAEVAMLCERHRVGTVVMGESADYSGAPNVVQDHILAFQEALRAATHRPVVLHPEYLTSAEADRIVGRDDLTDARAAALILKHYIDFHQP